MYILRLGGTTYALHVNDKTMFMGFREKRHAVITQRMLKRFVSVHKTLPVNCVDRGPLHLPLASPADWPHIISDMEVVDINDIEMRTMCEMCNGGYLYVTNMMNPEGFKLSYEGEIYDGYEVNIDTIKMYLESLL